MTEAHVELPLSGKRGEGKVTLVDPDIAERLAGRKLCLSNEYVAFGVYLGPGRQTTRKLHRFVVGLENGERGVVDHINRDPLDNRRVNLRVTTQAANLHNKVSTRGPYWRAVQQLPSGFMVMVQHQRQMHYLGVFRERREAWWVGEQWRRANVPDYIPQDS